MRYFVGFLLTIGLIIILILLLFGGDSSPKTGVTSKTLESYANTNAEVKMTIDGPVNAESLHNQVRISVDRNNVSLEHINGYNGDVVSMQRYANSKAAYAHFLKALAHAGFTQGNTAKEMRDERGYCPLGKRYVFELVQGTKSVQRFWSTSCGKPKTYLGSASLTISLFQAQVPGYNDLVRDIDL